MSKSQVVNTIANNFGLDRSWLNQFQVSDLNDMLNDLQTKLKN